MACATLSTSAIHDFSVVPPSMYSLIHGTRFNPGDFSPFVYAMADSIDREKAIFSRVAGLLLSGSPSAIFRGVSRIIVDTIQRCLRVWLAPHVGQEIVEAVKPTFANLNASAPVVLISDSLLTTATLFHVQPGAVLGSKPCPMRFTMSPTPGTVPVHAPTRLDSAVEKVGRGQDFLNPTFAPNSPQGAATISRRVLTSPCAPTDKLNDGEMALDVAGDVYDFRHFTELTSLFGGCQ